VSAAPNPLDVLVDLETERAVLGNALLDAATVPVVADVPPELYHHDAHRALAMAIIRLARTGTGVEPGTVQAELERMGRWGDVGVQRLAVIQEAATVASQLPRYVEKLRELAARRALVRISREAQHQAGDLTVPIDGLLARHLAACATVEQLGTATLVLGPAEIAAEMTTLTDLPRIAAGLWIYDAEGGLTVGDLHVLAARPRMGKTSAAIQIAHHVSHVLGLPTLLISAEMSRRQIELRLRALAEPNDTRASGLHLIDPTGISAAAAAALIRREVALHAVQVVLVDHLQQLKATRTRESRRDLEIREVVEALAESAKGCGVVVLALSQLNREIERRNSPAPLLSDLRDGGAIEELAATVTFLYSEEPGAEDRDDAVIPATFVQRKNRHEPPRKWRARFLRPHRFEGVA
jgi:replicative DNA helicase